MKVIGIVMMTLALLLSACDTVDQSEVAATLASGDAILATEAAMMNATAIAQQQEIGVMIAANQTEVANMRQVNAVWGELVDTSNTPAPPLRVGAVPMPDFEHLYRRDEIAPFWPGVIAPEVRGFPTLESATIRVNPAASGLGTGQVLFTGLTTQLDDNNCGINVRTTFFAERDGGIIYTMRLRDVPAGVNFRLEWVHDDTGGVRWTESWTTNRRYDDECIWRNILQSSTQFLPGNWTVYLYANGVRVVDQARFLMRPD